jgi:1,2-dihydroxy-3-keto-5-methylthiopentene dioxygenase
MTTTTATRPSTLRVFDENDGSAPAIETTDGSEIARLLGEAGVRFERWEAEAPLAPDADADAVLAAYRTSVARVQADGGYGTVDVIRMQKGAANAAEMRAKFLDEHSHTEDEVRFFVEGSGAFYLRANDRVYQAICVRGDLISVPAGTRHWFDMGPDPEFTAIRWFNNQTGWVPQFTGDTIAKRFPTYD